MNVRFCWAHQAMGFDAPTNCPACRRRARIVDSIRRGALDQVTAEEIESIHYQVDRGLSSGDIERAVARGINNRGSY